jgi:hypothetical protein
MASEMSDLGNKPKSTALRSRRTPRKVISWSFAGHFIVCVLGRTLSRKIAVTFGVPLSLIPPLLPP